jgi:hypothetical protein
VAKICPFGEKATHIGFRGGAEREMTTSDGEVNLIVPAR